MCVEGKSFIVLNYMELNFILSSSLPYTSYISLHCCSYSQDYIQHSDKED